jgi:ABC-type antimicrobial peptide transport system permease subunit
MLLLISFLVCMVGIANAMLMSITERFREIATMKCLGATDRYVLLQFMMEAGLQGAAGGVLGLLAGFLIANLKGAVELQGYLFAYWPAGGLVLAGAVSLVAGILLSVLASIYPAWSASRMAPMEAMRVE